MYDTNGLTLNDLYPYGQQHGDAAGTGYTLPELLQPINNLIGLGSHGVTATSYQVSCILHSYTYTSYGIPACPLRHESHHYRIARKFSGEFKLAVQNKTNNNINHQ